MISPDEGKSGNAPQLEIAAEPAAKDIWVYVQDERLRYPKLWRLLIRVHTRAFHLAYPDLALSDVWKLGDIILQDSVIAIQELGGSQEEWNCFHLQVPVFPAEREVADFEGRWRGWLSVGKPQLVY